MNWKDILALPQAHNSTNFTQNLSRRAQSNPQKWGNQILLEQSEFTEEYKHTFSPQNMAAQCDGGKPEQKTEGER